MGEYIWKVNMIYGKSYNVYTDERDLLKFIDRITPQKPNSEIRSFFECVEEYEEGTKCKFNSVVILGSKVCSVEYYRNR